MTLRQRAERAAKNMGSIDCPACAFFPGGDGPCDKCIADAIENVAKEFAEKACKKLVPVDHEIWFMDEEAQARHVAAAIAEAEKD